MTFDPKAHLIRQLSFLERSAAAFDEGYEDEAIRIAVILRVLFHNTKNSTSLLKHLNSTTINIRSTAMFIPSSVPMPDILRGLGVVEIDEETVTYIPGFDDVPISKEIPFTKWWNQMVFKEHKIELSRRKIVLVASNQDGGAHVDSKLNEDYQWLTQDGAYATVSGCNKKGIPWTIKIRGAHFVSLRQMAHEVLSSSQLLELA